MGQKPEERLAPGAEDVTNTCPSHGTGYVLRVASPGTITSFPFPNKGVIHVGRGFDQTIRVPMPDMSRRHISFRWSADEALQIADVGSSNGTTIRGQRLTANEWQPLALRELVCVRDAALVVHEGTVGEGAKRTDDKTFEATVQRQLKAGTPFGVGRIEVDSDVGWVEFVLALLAKDDLASYRVGGPLQLLLVHRRPEEIDHLTAFLERALLSFSPVRKVSMRASPRDGQTLNALDVGARRATPPPPKEAPTSTVIVVRSPTMQKLYELASEVARTPTSIVILGETGVGKDVLARAIHERSDRASGSFVGLNCAALPEALLESELFGYERGAFTGAVAPKAGLLEVADGGTVFLDEVGEMPLATQAKLLRVLEERKVMRVGGLRPKAVDFRLLSATNRNLQYEIAVGRFRADLFYRINGLSIKVPALRDRREEIPLLAKHFAARAAETLQKPIPTFGAEVVGCLERYSWPGNIRELRSVVERAVLLARGKVLVEHLPEEVGAAIAVSPRPTLPADEELTYVNLRLPELREETPAIEEREPPPTAVTSPPKQEESVVSEAPPNLTESGVLSRTLKEEVERLEYERIEAALREHGGNQTRAARALGMTRRALIVRVERFGMPRPRKPPKE